MTWDFDDDAVPVPGRQLTAYLRITPIDSGARVEVQQLADNDTQASFLTTAWEMVLGRFAAAHRPTRPSRPRLRRTEPVRTREELGMKIPKPTEADRDRFHTLVPDEPEVATKPMFGNLGAFVNGNMFMGLFGSDVGVKLDETDRSKLAAKPGTGPFGPPERPMAGYITLPAGWTARQARTWTAKAYKAAAALPPKATARRRTAKKP